MKQYTIYFAITWTIEEGEDMGEVIYREDHIDTNYLTETLEEMAEYKDTQILNIVKNY